MDVTLLTSSFILAREAQIWSPIKGAEISVPRPERIKRIDLVYRSASIGLKLVLTGG
jgi:hypothetical protein